MGEIRNQTACVPKSVSLIYPTIDNIAIWFILSDGSQVAGAEHVCLLLDLEHISRKNPLVINESYLLHSVDVGVIENDGCTGSVDSHHGVNQRFDLDAHELLLGVGPDREYAAHGEVDVNDIAAVNGVVAHNIAFSLSDLLQLGLLLTDVGLDFLVLLEVLFNDFIAVQILLQLLKAESVKFL